MKKAFRFFPLLIVFYIPFYFYNSEGETVVSTPNHVPKSKIELSGYFEDSNHSAILFWSAQRCSENDYFLIERREDSSSYHVIDSILITQSDGNLGNYEYVDYSDLDNFSSLNYRISYSKKTVDIVYSNELQLSPNGTTGFKSVNLYPNPAANNFTVEFSTDMENGEVVIYDLLGTELARKPFKGDEQRLFFDCSSWPNGIYNLVIYAGDDNLQLRLSVKRVQI